MNADERRLIRVHPRSSAAKTIRSTIVVKIVLWKIAEKNSHHFCLLALGAAGAPDVFHRYLQKLTGSQCVGYIFIATVARAA
jgi:hypothetical protein